MRICFDLDDTLCTGYPYTESVPKKGARELLQSLRDEGHTIIIMTARGMWKHQGNTGAVLADYAKVTLEQLDAWGFVYDEVLLGSKPSADAYVDDKAVQALPFDTLKERLDGFLNH